MWWLAWTVAASAGPVTWESVADEAIDTWAGTGGEVVDARVDGAVRARRVATRGPSVAAQAQAGMASANQVTVYAQADLALGLRARQLWDRRADALRAEGAVGRQDFVERVLDAWTTWWMAQELAEHLDAWSDEVEATLRPLDEAVKEGIAAPLDAEDLRTELAGVRAEAAAIRAQAVRAEAELRALLGEDVTLDTGELHLHDLDVAGLQNPWSGLVSRAGDAPRVQAVLAQAGASEASARFGARWVPTLQGGFAAADANGPWGPLGYVGIELPLRPAGLSEARMERAHATALRREADWRTDLVRGAWTTEASAFEADRERIRRLDEEVVGPLERRLRRLEDAFADGLVPADRVIRARRDHHEAEHERLVLAARLLASRAHAQATLRLLESK